MLTNQNGPKVILASLFAVARRLSIQMRVLRSRMRSRSTLVNPNAFHMFSDALSLDACRSKCNPRALRMRSRSTLVDTNAFPMCSNELSPDARRSKCVSIRPASDDTNQNGTDGLLSIHTIHDSRAFIFLSMFVFTER